ncbi:hypothetical protein FACS1894154_05580 [Betaproteobacteria bacterium]|nr:hypothetical protein AGMMS49543_18940 [Betaproteobacteria bacterium]GHT99102.1 hypothetical protein FACS1894154_05580 [Betaproteobacteria bacterium]
MNTSTTIANNPINTTRNLAVASTSQINATPSAKNGVLDPVAINNIARMLKQHSGKIRFSAGTGTSRRTSQ